MYPLRGEKPGLHPNLTCVRGDRGCRNPIPRDVAETRGFNLKCAQGQKKLKGLPRATHCTDRAQTSGNVSPTVELCPLHPTFRTKVRARRDVPKGKKSHNYTYTYRLYRLLLYTSEVYIFTYNILLLTAVVVCCVHIQHSSAHSECLAAFSIPPPTMNCPPCQLENLLELSTRNSTAKKTELAS